MKSKKTSAAAAATPVSSAPAHGIQIRIQPAKPSLPEGKAASISLMITVTPDALAAAKGPAKGVNLALVLDRSGSMAYDSRMAMAKEAAKGIIRQLQAEDKVSLVTFSDHVRVLAGGCPGTDYVTLCHLIDAVDARGCTDLHSGWLNGANEVAENFTEGCINRVILLSDGQTNRGETRESEIIRQVSDLGATGVSTTTVGVGHGFNEDLLQAMAEAGDGNYHYANVAADLPEQFRNELHQQRLMVGTQVKIFFRPAPGVVLQPPINNLTAAEEGGYKLGNLMAGKNHKIVVEALMPPANGPLLEVVVHWLDANGQRQEKVEPLVMDRVNMATYKTLPSCPDVERQSALLQCAVLKQAAAVALQDSRPESAQHLLQEGVALLTPFGDHAEAAQMAASLRREQDQIDRGEVWSSRKSLKHQSYSMRHRSESL